MTMNIFLHPEGIPTLFSDCLVTHSKTGQDHPIDNFDLWSKILVTTDPKFFFAFAGEGDAIKDFAHQLPALVKQSGEHVRPARYIGDCANQFNENYNFGKPDEEKTTPLSVLGFTDVFVEGQLATNIVYGAKRWSLETKYFNEVFANGSGAQDILGIIEEHDNGLIEAPEGVTASRFQMLRGLWGRINAQCFFSFQGARKTKNRWGLFVEAVCRSPEEPGFFCFPSLLCLGFDLDTSNNTISQYRRSLQSSTTAKRETMLRIWESDGKSDMLGDIPLSPLIKLGDATDPGDFDWEIGVQSTVALQLSKSENGVAKVRYYSLNPWEHEYLIGRDNDTKFTLDETFLRELFSKFPD